MSKSLDLLKGIIPSSSVKVVTNKLTGKLGFWVQKGGRKLFMELDEFVKLRDQRFREMLKEAAAQNAKSAEYLKKIRVQAEEARTRRIKGLDVKGPSLQLRLEQVAKKPSKKRGR